MALKEKLELLFHVRSSKHFAKEVGRSIRDIEKDQDRLKGYIEEITRAIQIGNAVSLKHYFLDFIKTCGHEVSEIESSNQNEFVIEHRIIKSLRKADEELGQLKDKSVLHVIDEKKGGDNVVKKLMADIDLLHGLFSNVVSQLKKGKMRARDLKHNHQYLRDRNLLPERVLFELAHMQSKIQARNAYSEVKHAESLYHDVHELIAELHQGNSKDHEVVLGTIGRLADKITKDLKDFDKVIIKEFDQAAKIEQELIVISFRLFEMNQEEMKKLDDLVHKEGFPEQIAEEIKKAEEDFERHWQHEESEDYRFTKELFHEGNRL